MPGRCPLLGLPVVLFPSALDPLTAHRQVVPSPPPNRTAITYLNFVREQMFVVYRDPDVNESLPVHYFFNIVLT